MNLNFDNTEIAFASLSNKELKKAYYIFQLLNQPLLSSIGKTVTMFAFSAKLPIKGLIKSTIFDAFVGGETVIESEPEINMLAQNNIRVILDYGVEAKDAEEELDNTMHSIAAIIDQIASTNQQNLDVCSKITAIAPNQLLTDVSAGNPLSDIEQKQWNRVKERLNHLCKKAIESNVKLYIDAEESWMQDAIDDLVDEMMQKYNKEKPFIFNTIQLYRHDRLAFFKHSHQKALTNGYILGAKLVRGAYMEKERKRASDHQLPSPIQSSKEDTDRDYNLAIEYFVNNINTIAACVATHNEESNYYLNELLEKNQIPVNHSHIITAQLFGMGDHITFNMANASYNATKYLPYGPVEELLPYLLRRAKENSSVDGQASRELNLVRRELKRRKLRVLF